MKEVRDERGETWEMRDERGERREERGERREERGEGRGETGERREGGISYLSYAEELMVFKRDAWGILYLYLNDSLISLLCVRYWKKRRGAGEGKKRG